MAYKANLQTFPVRVDGIDNSISESDIRDRFKNYGEIFSVRIMPHKDLLATTYGFVNFADRGDSEVAAMKMNGQKLNGCTLKTSVDADKTKPRPDHRAYTDCKYMSSSEGCDPKDGKQCPYRHKNITSGKICGNWKSRKCTNRECADLHPPLQNEKESTLISPVTPRSSNELTKKLEAICECGICLERLKIPKMLQCQHSFCSECLEDLVQLGPSMLQSGVFAIQCPTCRNLHELKDGTTVFNLDENLQLKMNLDLLQESDNTSFTPSSYICNEENCNRNVTTYCVKCSCYYCDQCKITHDLYGACEEFHSVKYSNKEESIWPYCDKHNCLSKKMCEQCSTFLCFYCSKLNQLHEDHNIISLKDHAEKLMIPIRDLVTRIDSDKIFYQQYSNDIKSSQDAVKKETQELRKCIADWKKKMLANFIYALEISQLKIWDTFSRSKSQMTNAYAIAMIKSKKALLSYEAVKEQTNDLFRNSSFEKIMQASDFHQSQVKVLEENSPGDVIANPIFELLNDSKEISVENLVQVALSSFGELKIKCYENQKENEMYQIDFLNSTAGNCDFKCNNLESFILKAMKDMKIFEEKNFAQMEKSNEPKKKKEKNKPSPIDTTAVPVNTNNESKKKKQAEKKKEKKELPKKPDLMKIDTLFGLHSNESSNMTQKSSIAEFDPFHVQEDQYNSNLATACLIDVGDKEDRGDDDEVDDDDDDDDDDSDDANSVASNDTTDGQMENENGNDKKTVRRRRARGGRGRKKISNTGNIRNNPPNNAQTKAKGSSTGQKKRAVSQAGILADPISNVPSHPGYTASNPQHPFRAHQRPSPASSMPNLNPQARTVMCYKCGRCGHTVQTCKSRTTKDGRPLLK